MNITNSIKKKKDIYLSLIQLVKLAMYRFTGVRLRMSVYVGVEKRKFVLISPINNGPATRSDRSCRKTKTKLKTPGIKYSSIPFLKRVKLATRKRYTYVGRNSFVAEMESSQQVSNKHTHALLVCACVRACVRTYAYR